MEVNKTNIRKDFFKTKSNLLSLNKKDIMRWFLYYGYYGDKYKYPPIFKISKFEEQDNTLMSLKNKKKKIYDLLNLEIKYDLNNKRIFSLIHPYIYYEIVKLIVDNWDNIIEHIYNDELKIYSFSFPLPLNNIFKNIDNDSSSQIMIYNFTSVEENLTADSYNYKYILRADISKCYHSIYTHSIAWALEGRDAAYKDKQKLNLLGNKFDRYFQIANHFQTNGIPIGPAVSDIMAEIVLSRIDRNVSLDKKVMNINFMAARYKDDYRFLCNTEKDAIYLKEVLEDKLKEYNLWINSNKTFISKLPNGLERKWKKLYDKNCILPKRNLKYRDFINAYYSLIEIEEKYPGSAMISKFLDSLIDRNEHVIFSSFNTKQKIKLINLISLLIDNSPRILPQILSMIEIIIKDISKESEFYNYIKDFINSMYSNLVNNDRIDEYRLIWIYYFSKKHKLDLDFNINDNIRNFVDTNKFIKYMVDETNIFDYMNDNKININIYDKNGYKEFIYHHISLYHKKHHNIEEEEYDNEDNAPKLI